MSSILTRTVRNQLSRKGTAGKTPRLFDLADLLSVSTSIKAKQTSRLHVGGGHQPRPPHGVAVFGLHLSFSFVKEGLRRPIIRGERRHRTRCRYHSDNRHIKQQRSTATTTSPAHSPRRHSATSARVVRAAAAQPSCRRGIPSQWDRAGISAPSTATAQR